MSSTFDHNNNQVPSPALTPRSNHGNSNNPNLSPSGITRIEAVNHLNSAVDVDNNKPTLRDATNKSVCII